MATTSPARDWQKTIGITWWQRVFWFIGGFDSETLAQPQCRAIRSKYSSMGALVLLTALLASCSGGYAIYTIFQDSKVTWLMGALWGLMILTLDRFLVSSTRKLAVMKDFSKEPNALPPYTRKNPWLTLAVRLPLALVIGLVVSAPLEVRLMQPWINDYESRLLEADIDKTNKDFNKGQEEINQRYKDLADIQKAIVVAQEAVRAEEDGKGSPLGPSCGSICKDKQSQVDKLEKDAAELKTAIQADEKRLQDDRENQQKSAKSEALVRDQGRSVISDLAAIQRLAAGDMPNAKERTPVVRLVVGFLTMLFVLIECIPVLAKAMSSFDPYDAMLQEIEHGGVLDSLVEARRRYAEASLSE